MNRTIRYWRDLLGMRLVAGFGRPGYRHYFFELSETDMIAFFEWPEVENPPLKDPGVPVKGPYAFDHVSLAVSGDDDLFELKDRISAAGFWTSEVVDHGFIHSLYTFDPNDIPLEFSAPVATIDIRRHPVMKDRSPAAAALEGAAPQPVHRPKSRPSISSEDARIYPADGAELFSEPGEKPRKPK
jgi:catechol 2,3-dioxygenase-like lactoylglutathione lyase family enzyme